MCTKTFWLSKGESDFDFKRHRSRIMRIRADGNPFESTTDSSTRIFSNLGRGDPFPQPWLMRAKTLRLHQGNNFFNLIRHCPGIVMVRAGGSTDGSTTDSIRLAAASYKKMTFSGLLNRIETS